MGMTVEASIASRSLAELATGAADDDARQNEDHAGDTEQVGEMLRAECRMVVRVAIGHEVDRDIECAGDEHHGEANQADRRHVSHLFQPVLYR
jgi:hypothetical protein